MENKVCAKCGKELKDYEINYRSVDGKATELCRICAMAVDYMSSKDEEKKPEPAEAVKETVEKPQPPKKLTKADIDSILVPSGSEKSSSSSLLSGLFESNNNISTVMKVFAVLILLAGVIAAVVFAVSAKDNMLLYAVICLVLGIVLSLLFLALGEIISLLTSINGKMR